MTQTKEARKEYKKEYYKKNIDKRKKYLLKNKEKIEKQLKKYYKNNKTKLLKEMKIRSNNNKDRLKEYRKEYYIKNKDKLKEYYIKNEEHYKEYRIKNKDKLKRYNDNLDRKEYMKKYTREKRKTDDIFRIKNILRNRIRNFLKRKQWAKQSRTMDMLGCTGKELKEYLEKQFTLGMNWKNHGFGWHIDHIIPLASVKTKEDLIKLCHYTNLQPLWARENISKGAKCQI